MNVDRSGLSAQLFQSRVRVRVRSQEDGEEVSVPSLEHAQGLDGRPSVLQHARQPLLPRNYEVCSDL